MLLETARLLAAIPGSVVPLEGVVDLANEPLMCAAGVSLIGGEQTVLSYDGTGQAVRIVDASIPNAVEAVTLKNLRILAPNAARGIYGLWFRRCVLENVVVEGAEVGIHIHGGGDPTVGAWWNTFTRCRTLDCGTGFKFTGTFNQDGTRNGFANANTLFDCEVFGGDIGVRVGEGVDTIRMFGGHIQTVTTGAVTVRGPHFEAHGLRIENAGQYGYEIAAPHFKRFGGSIARTPVEYVGPFPPEVWL